MAFEQVLEHVNPALFDALGDPHTLRKRIELELARRRYEGNLHEYIRAAWNTVEPGTKFIDGWHIGAIAEHLQACHERQIRNLVINMPPRHMKSLTVGVAWPTWVWTKAPHSRWVFSSYSGQLSTRDAVKSRRLITSPWYQTHWGDRFTLTSDQNQKTRYENDKTGYRVATSVGGTMTGEGGDFIVVDDPHNVVDIVNSPTEAQLESVIEWWDQAMSTRLNDPKTGVRVIVMQRLHQSDLVGHVLKERGWDQLILPAEYEPKVYSTSIGWSDPRKEDGELLWPQRFDREALDKIKTALGSRGTAAQLQQRPAPREGAMIKLAWLSERWRLLPPKDTWRRVTQSWDTAKKDNERNDYSVCTTWVETENRHYLADLFAERLQFPDLVQAAKDQYNKWSPGAVLIEDAASGTSLIQELQRTSLMPILPQSTRGLSKEQRVEAVTPVFESGRVVLPEETPWVADYVTELITFPAVTHDDRTDSTSQYLYWAAAPMDIFIG